MLYAARAYNSLAFETELRDLNLMLIPQRKRASKNQHSGCLRFLQVSGRKAVKTVFSQILRIMPRSFSVRTASGLHLRIVLLLLAYTAHRFTPALMP